MRHGLNSRDVTETVFGGIEVFLIHGSQEIKKERKRNVDGR